MLFAFFGLGAIELIILAGLATCVVLPAVVLLVVFVVLPQTKVRGSLATVRLRYRCRSASMLIDGRAGESSKAACSRQNPVSWIVSRSRQLCTIAE